MQPINSVPTGPFNVYVEGNVRPEMRGGFMSKDVYEEVVRNMIIPCTDCVIINSERKTFFLADRTSKPMQGLWWTGGRRNKGEMPVDGMARNFNRETGLSIEPSRFKLITITEYLWQDRAQEPEDIGTHGICHMFALELSYDEIQAVANNLDEKEYRREAGLREFGREALVSAGVHPVILEVYDLCFPS